MKFLLIILLFNFSTKLFAEINLDKFLGCYTTYQFNGASVNIQDSLQGMIQIDSSPYLDEVTKKSFPTIKLFLYQGRLADNMHHMQISYIPLDRGAISEKQDQILYEYDGNIRFTTKPEQVFTLHIKVGFQIQDKNFIKINIFNQFDQIGRGVNSEFLLLKTDCL